MGKCTCWPKASRVCCARQGGAVLGYERGPRCITGGRVYKHGHFQFTSGLHSDIYLEKFQVMQYPKYTEILCAEMARRTKHLKPDVIIGPAVGGIILAYEVGGN